jgi:hypothetical protein
MTKSMCVDSWSWPILPKVVAKTRLARSSNISLEGGTAPRKRSLFPHNFHYFYNHMGGGAKSAIFQFGDGAAAMVFLNSGREDKGY